jgi:hypothetical protein
MLNVARAHLLSRGQPNTIIAHFEFLNRTEIGPAVFIVDDTKIGKRTSVMHIAVYQHALLPQAPWITKGSSRLEVAAYITNSSIASETGLSLPTGYSISPSPPTVDIAKLRQGVDPNWIPTHKHLQNSYAAILKRVNYFGPRQGQHSKSTHDVWIQLANGEKLTDSLVAYVADSWPYVVEAYRPSREEAKNMASVPYPPKTTFWYPTLALNLEVKKALPSNGVDFLFIRVVAKEIKNGRFDLEVIIMDEHGDLVALSNHVNLILGSERNMAKRSHESGKI